MSCMLLRYLSALAFVAVLGQAQPGIITTVIGTGVAGASGDGGRGANAQLNTPNGVAVDAAGNVYIADYLNSRIRKVLTTDFTQTIAGCGPPPSCIDQSVGRLAGSTAIFNPWEPPTAGARIQRVPSFSHVASPAVAPALLYFDVTKSGVFSDDESSR